MDTGHAFYQWCEYYWLTVFITFAHISSIQVHLKCRQMRVTFWWTELRCRPKRSFRNRFRNSRKTRVSRYCRTQCKFSSSLETLLDCDAKEAKLVCLKLSESRNFGAGAVLWWSSLLKLLPTFLCVSLAV